MNLAFWSNLNILGDLGETFIFSSLSVRLMEQFPASKPVPFREVSQQTYFRTLLASVCVAIGENSYFQRREEESGGSFRTNNPLIFNTSHPLNQPLLSFSQQHFPCTKGHITSSKSPRQQETVPEKQTFWGTDPLGVPKLTISSTVLHYLILFKA